MVTQASLQAFINALSPGAYSSITKVNFQVLDDFLLKPIGVYGSKEEIVRFLCEMGAVDFEMCVFPQCIAESLHRIYRARELLVPQRDYTAKGADPILRSGLYVVRTFTSNKEEQACVLYWPEDKTWDDNADSTVRLIRVTFMRFGSISRHFLSQRNELYVDTSPNYAINSFACFHLSTRKQLY